MLITVVACCDVLASVPTGTRTRCTVPRDLVCLECLLARAVDARRVYAVLWGAKRGSDPGLCEAYIHVAVPFPTHAFAP
jgi:hypothetical protein